MSDQHFPGDVVGGFELQRLVAVQGKEGCTNPMCRRVEGESHCRGYHCPLCDAPTNMYGHHDCPRAADVEAVGA